MPHNRDDLKHIIRSRTPVRGMSQAYEADGAKEQYHIADGIVLAASDPLQDGFAIDNIRYLSESQIIAAGTFERVIPDELARTDRYVRICDYNIRITANGDPWVLDIVVSRDPPGIGVPLSQWTGSADESLSSSITPGEHTAETSLQGLVVRPRDEIRFTVTNNGTVGTSIDVDMRFNSVPRATKPATR